MALDGAAEKKEINQKKCTFCPIPWKELTLTNSGTIQLCCSSVSGINLSKNEDGSYCRISAGIDEGLNSKVFQDVREKMLRNEWPQQCAICEDKEKYSVKSKRQDALERHPNFNPQTHITSASNITRLDLRLGNLCNLKCRMCDPYNSSSWLKDWELLGNKVKPIPEANKKRLQTNWFNDKSVIAELKKTLPHVNYIRLTGGEPLIHPNNKVFLRECISSGRAHEIKLKYFTNGTVIDEETIELWKAFQQVHVGISVDALGPLLEYIRYPLKWPTLLKNLERYKELSHQGKIKTSIQVAAQPYNIFQIPELVHFFEKFGFKVFLNTVEKPAYLSLGILNQQKAHRAILGLNQIASHPHVSGLIRRLNSSKKHLWDEFLDFTDSLDKIRGQNGRALVPDLFSEN